MSATDVLDQYGAWALAKTVTALLLVLALYLVRWPLLLAVRLVTAAMSGVDGVLAASVTSPVGAGRARRNL